jgi:hypothetical protein
MKESLLSSLGVDAEIVQNGINVMKLSKLSGSETSKEKIVSMRGIAPNYRIGELLDEFKSKKDQKLFVCAPFVEKDYYESIISSASNNIVFLDKLSRDEYHQLLLHTKIVISIPISDSSPRSVYEAIFSGAVALCTFHPYIDELPLSMKRRIVVVDVDKHGWLDRALLDASVVLESSFEPCTEALEKYDQMQSMRKVISFAKEILHE